ncbi:MAG: hypothetical protein AB7S48_14100 [Bacteroidales bacterium]
MSKAIKLVHWSPRILCIIAILFISMFALDAFEDNTTIWQKIGAFAIHLIPSYILTALLIVAWKWERIGGIFFIAIGLGFMPFIIMHNYAMNQSVLWTSIIVLSINIPFVIVGILFLISHHLKLKNRQ